MTEHQFFRGILELKARFPNGAPEDEDVKDYYSDLKSWPDDVFKEAIKLTIRNRRYRTFPLIADLIKACKVAYREVQYAMEEELAGECPKCFGMGWIILGFIQKGDYGPRARPCGACRIGRKVKARQMMLDGKCRRKPEPTAEDLGYPADWDTPIEGGAI